MQDKGPRSSTHPEAANPCHACLAKTAHTAAGAAGPAPAIRSKDRQLRCKPAMLSRQTCGQQQPLLAMPPIQPAPHTSMPAVLHPYMLAPRAPVRQHTHLPPN